MQHTAAKSFTAGATILTKSVAALPAFRPGGLDTLYVSQDVTISRGELTAEFKNGDAIKMPGHLTPGADYEVVFDVDRSLCVMVHGTAAEQDLSVLGGFHYAPTGNALAREGGDAIPAINRYSIYDLNFRPACPDPRGMALIDDGFWCDIYLLGINHQIEGTSRWGAKIADGGSLDRLNYADAVAILAGHGKQLLGVTEFWSAAIGVKERVARVTDPKTTDIRTDDLPFVSKHGIQQATGCLWTWGHDEDPDTPRASIFGGSWIGGQYAGSRGADLGCWPDHSFEVIGARGRSDHLIHV